MPAHEPQRLNVYDSHFIYITGEFGCRYMFRTVIQKQNDNLHIVHVHTNTEFVNGDTACSLRFDAL